MPCASPVSMMWPMTPSITTTAAIAHMIVLWRPSVNVAEISLRTGTRNTTARVPEHPSKVFLMTYVA